MYNIKAILHSKDNIRTYQIQTKGRESEKSCRKVNVPPNDLKDPKDFIARKAKKAGSEPLGTDPAMRTAATYSPALRCSTIGATGLNFSVRDGKRWSPGAVAA